MLFTFLEFVWWLQAPGTAPGGGGGGGGTVATGGDPGMGCAMQSGLMLAMLAVFYFALMRPEKKRREAHEEMLRSLRKGTKVRTSGGLLGEVVAVLENDEVLLQLADRVRVNVLRSNISAVESARKASEPANASPRTPKADEKDGTEASLKPKLKKRRASSSDDTDASAQDGA